MIRRIYLLIFLLAITGCKKKNFTVIRLSGITKNIDKVNKLDSKIKVTVFVHGTVLVPKFLFHDFFFSIYGLQPNLAYDKKYRLRKIGDCLAKNQDEFPAEHIYHFGWDGELSFKKREEMGKNLLNEITQLKNKYIKEYEKEPQITVITHSHGGNVALNMAKFNNDFVVDRLILLACPVQKETENFVKNKLFKSVYSFYSTLDSLQVLDPQGAQIKKENTPLFSQREFPKSENLRQIKIKLNGRGIMHIEFLLEKFLERLTMFLEKVEEVDQKQDTILISFWNKRTYIR